MDKPFETRITELFGIRLPIIAGGLQWLANAEYVAAAANAGIMGFITAADIDMLDSGGGASCVRRPSEIAGDS